MSVIIARGARLVVRVCATRHGCSQGGVVGDDMTFDFSDEVAAKLFLPSPSVVSVSFFMYLSLVLSFALSLAFSLCFFSSLSLSLSLFSFLSPSLFLAGLPLSARASSHYRSTNVLSVKMRTGSDNESTSLHTNYPSRSK